MATPGPWTVGATQTETAIGGFHMINPPDGHAPVAYVATPVDARLIAAAPELLKAAHAAYHALQSYAYGNAAPDLARTCSAVLDEAIAKAEGR